MDDYDMEELHLEDRLSELPQSLILHILSFLPIRDVISTTLLSKRWENLWTTIPCLNFSDIISLDDEPDRDSMRNFVNRALISWEGTKLLKFIIDDYPHCFDMSLTGDMNLWVRYAVRYKVEELSICLAYDDIYEELEGEEAVKEDIYTAPQCLNSCSSLRKLSLKGCNLRIQGSPAWDQLKSLRIDGFYLSEHLIDRILLGAPQLEEFELRLLDSNNENLNICSTSIKKLKIGKYGYIGGAEPSLDTVMRINCPNLETLDISDGFYSKRLFTNVSSLTDATLDFKDIKYYHARGIKLSGEMTSHVFSTFGHVERLTLTKCYFQVLGASQKKNFSLPLPNVLFLKLRIQSIELVEMVHLLEIFPNLKMLVIYEINIRNPSDISAANYLELETNLSKSFLLQLKIIDITSNFFDSSIYQCIEFFLKHASVLEKLVIRTHSPASHFYAHFLEVAGRLLSMSRPSPATKVIFNIK